MNEVYTVEATKVYDEQVLREVIKLDKMVYPENLQGVFDAEKERFMKVPESFLLLKQGDTIVGYFCFFPITRTIRRRMMNEDRLFDNDITAADMKPFKKWDSHTLFIICSSYRSSSIPNTVADRHACFWTPFTTMSSI